MGQPVKVTVKETLDPNVRRFETDRWLTGMGGRLYFAPEFRPAGAPAPPPGSLEAAVLEIPGVISVYTYGSTVTVSKDDKASWDDLARQVAEKIESAFSYYKVAS